MHTKITGNILIFLSTYMYTIIDKYNYKTMYVFLFKYGVYSLINTQFKLLQNNPMLIFLFIRY